MHDDSDPTQDYSDPTKNYSDPTQDEGAWGGLRDNSAEIHKHKVLREFKCDWCKKLFMAHHPQSRFCCANHRVQAWQAKQVPKSKRLTALVRKGKMFRPPRLLVEHIKNK